MNGARRRPDPRGGHQPHSIHAFRGLRRLPAKSRRCYTFAASQGRFPPPSVKPSTVHDPIAAGRSAAARAVAIEVAAVGVVAAMFLVQGWRSAAGAAAGGLAMAAGHAMAAAVSFGGGIQPARLAFARLLLGVMGKWLVAMAGVALALGVWQLPSLPVVVGVVAGLLAYLVGLNLRHAFRQQATRQQD